jgi:hypothetical protein
MRATLLVSLLILAAALAGCSGGGDKDKDDTKTQTTTSGTGTKTNTTSAPPPPPNVSPVLAYKIMDDAGNPINFTSAGTNITISAEGSLDPDGNITGLAVSVADRNSTKFPRIAVLYDPATKAFTDAKFMMDFAGPVNITLAIVDDRAGFNSTVVPFAVNQVTTAASSFQARATGNAACSPSPDVPESHIVEQYYWDDPSFQVDNQTTYVTAKTDVTDVSIIICDPSKTAISPAGAGQTGVSSNAGVVFQNSINYYVAVLNVGTATPAAPKVVNVEITVHYDAPAAAA